MVFLSVYTCLSMLDLWDASIATATPDLSTESSVGVGLLGRPKGSAGCLNGEYTLLVVLVLVQRSIVY